MVKYFDKIKFQCYFNAFLLNRMNFFTKKTNLLTPILLNGGSVLHNSLV